MTQKEVGRQTKYLLQETYLLSWVEAFLIDRRAAGLTPGSVKFYREKLKLFTDYCDSQVITSIEQITPVIIRQFLLYLEDKKHSPGGIACVYRSMKAFLLWYEKEAEPTAWKNPIRKVKAPRVPDEPIEPVEVGSVEAMVSVCRSNTFTGIRDKALLLFLLDTGLRVMECLALDLPDVEVLTGECLIRQGKGRKPRTAFFQQRTRRALRSYLKQRTDNNPALWVTDEFTRLQQGGVRSILHRRAKQAGVPIPSPHDFRRAFAINMLRNGVDVITLSRLMGHTSLAVLKRYLNQVSSDLRDAHAKGSPVENSKRGKQ